MKTINSRNTKRVSLGTTLALLCMVPSSAFGALKVTKDEDNVVSSRLEGKWTLDKALSERLGSEGSPTIFNFRAEENVIRKIPTKYAAFLEGRTIYMAGVFTRNEAMHPFVLIEVKGNPHIVYFRERDGDPLGDAESFNVMLPVAADRESDLLFVGGDFNNQPFAAFHRAGGSPAGTNGEPVATDEPAPEKSPGLKSYLGSWRDREKTLILTINSGGFHYRALKGDKVVRRGKIQLQDGRLVIGSPDEDGGYVVHSKHGSLLMKQEGSDFELELSKID